MIEPFQHSMTMERITIGIGLFIKTETINNGYRQIIKVIGANSKMKNEDFKLNAFISGILNHMSFKSIF